MDPGLCGACAHAGRVATPRSVFFRCGRWNREPARFPKYPPLPVRACAGFEPA